MPSVQPATYSARHQQQGADRRRHPRKEMRVRVDCFESGGRSWWGISRDLSRGGMFLEYTPGLSVGDTLYIAFVLPTGRPCRLEARVVRVEPIGAGLRFVEPAEAYSGTLFQDLASYCAA
jgi:PilZ domain-containing protein